MRACMCSLFHLALGNEDEEVQLVCNSTCCLAWGVVFDRRKNRGVVCVSLFLTRVGVYVGVCVPHARIHTYTQCVWARTHTQCTDGLLGVSPGVGMRHREGPKNPDELNPGIQIFVYVLCLQ